MPEPIREELVGAVCQSCGMPLQRSEQLGTSASGERIHDYCGFCYREGHFTEPNLTKEQMIEKSTNLLVTRQRMPRGAAEALARRTLSGLKRWLNGAA